MPSDPEPQPESETSASLFSAEDGSAILFEQTGCTTIGDATTAKVSNFPVVDTAYAYPVGLVDFNVSGCTVGGEETFSITFTSSRSVSEVTMRKYNSVLNTYTTLTTQNSGLVLAATTLEGKSAIKPTYRITDGGFLDQDGANGQIFDPIGLSIRWLQAQIPGCNAAST